MCFGLTIHFHSVDGDLSTLEVLDKVAFSKCLVASPNYAFLLVSLLRYFWIAV